jgi:SulP family sulfate permease
VSQDSSHTNLPVTAGIGGWGAWRTALAGALEGASSNIPLSLGCVTLVFSHLGPGLLGDGVLATMLALTVLHLLTSGSGRPIVYSARVFEATTLAAMLDQVIAQLPAWGLADTTDVRLAFLCLIGAGAGITVGLLYLMRADRFTPLIPAPVFAGFSNSIALALIISQSRSILDLLTTGYSAAVILSVIAASLLTALAVRRWRPRWPATAAALLAGLLVAVVWRQAGESTTMVSSNGWSLALPFMRADFSELLSPQARGWLIAQAIISDAAVLGTMLFINTTITSQAMTQIDGRHGRGMRDALVLAATLAGSGAAGSAPLSGGVMASAAVARSTPLAFPVMVITALLIAAVYLTGILGWIPLAAVCSAMLYEAWYMADRDSLRLLADAARGKSMPANAREDLALIAAVTATAVLLNMVAAVFAGLLLGLVLFAARSARRPVRHVWTGAHLSSNCARPRSDLAVLAEHGAGIKVFELEGDLFFGAAESLEQSLDAQGGAAGCVILDWSRVRHVDTSVALTIATLDGAARERGVLLIHAGGATQSSEVQAELSRQLPHGRFTPDLDYALELAENHVIAMHASPQPRDATSILEAVSLLHGVDAAGGLEQAMPQRFFAAGEVVVAAGEPADALMLVLHGSASVLVRNFEGKDVRLAGIRRGATIGEIGFLDQAPRSATVVAHEDMTVAVLDRARYDEMCRTQPHVVQQLLAHIALDLASRLRRTNRLALARNGRH